MFSIEKFSVVIVDVDDGVADAQDDDDDAGHDVGDLFWTLGHAVLVLDAAAKHFTTRCEPCHVCVH